MLLTVGDFRLGPDRVRGNYRWHARPAEMTDPNSYGMILRLDDDGQYEVISTGHRNAQGLAVDEKSGAIWSTEHGPRGGDELNKIEHGSDYGWPDVTYGAPYDAKPLPSEEWDIGRWASHEKFERPRFAWMGSIGTSQVQVYHGSEFPGWQGDLMVATLKDQSVRRLHVNEGHIVYDERIPIGHRIRDLSVDPAGRLLMSTDDGYLLRLSITNE